MCYANENEYTFEAGGSKCEECPEEAVCKGGTEIYPIAEYWRAKEDSDTFYECPVKGACLGGEDTKNPFGA